MFLYDDLLIRPALPGDAESIAGILKEVGWFDRVNGESPGVTGARIANYLRLYSEGEHHAVLVAQALDGRLEGYVAVHWIPYLFLPAPEGYISELFVRQSCRGRGVGRRLLQKVEEMARAYGCSRLMLINGRNRESYRRGFYKKLGWEERDEAANFVLPLGQ